MAAQASTRAGSSAICAARVLAAEYCSSSEVNVLDRAAACRVSRTWPLPSNNGKAACSAVSAKLSVNLV